MLSWGAGVKRQAKAKAQVPYGQHVPEKLLLSLRLRPVERHAGRAPTGQKLGVGVEGKKFSEGPLETVQRGGRRDRPRPDNLMSI